MPIVPSVQKGLTFSGDYGMDKWVSYKTGSVTSSGSGGTNTASVAHNLGYTPLVYTQWSEVADFSVPRENLQNPADLYSTTEPWIIRTAADRDNLYFYLQNWGGSSKTLYYRIWALAPTNVSQPVATTAGISGLTPLVFNGEQNYLKPYLTNVIVVASSSTVDHGLGYLPTTMVWVEGNAFVGVTPVGTMIAPVTSPVVYSDGIPTPFTPHVTTSQLVFPQSGTFHYRIYVEPIYE